MTVSNAAEVERNLLAAFSAGVRLVVADGTATVFCDSAGMRELVVAHKRGCASGITFRAVIPHCHLGDRLISSGLGNYLAIHSTPGDALSTRPPGAPAA
jgi:anti-anti-sigma regulatory factor